LGFPSYVFARAAEVQSGPRVARAAEFNSAATRVELGLRAPLVDGYSDDPNRIPEWEQRLRHSRTRD